MRHIKKIVLVLSGLAFTIVSYSQNYRDWNSYRGEQFYKKVDLPYGSVDQFGNIINTVFVPTEMKEGTFEVELVEESYGDIYLIKGTEIYLKFSSRTPSSRCEGILEIRRYGASEFFEKED